MSTLTQHASHQARRSRLTLAAVALTLAGVVAPATAATFQYRHYTAGMTSSPTSKAQQTAAEIVVALTGGPALPAGEVNWPYSYDLKQLLSVPGDQGYNSTNVSWELQSGNLPQGLSLGSDGVVSGIPTTKDTGGSSFQVKAAYKGKAAQKGYTIVVNGMVLRVTQVSSGSNHTCAVTATGGAKCWGDNSYGGLGNNSVVRSLSPVDVYGLTSGIISISSGYGHTCALTATGGVKCWGYNGGGQLGDSTLTNRLTPVDVYGLTTGVAFISSGQVHTCAVTIGGGAKCWGENTQGGLGDGSNTNRKAPVDVSGHTTGVASISAGLLHTCLVTTAGGAKCWGYSGQGRLGTGTSTTYVPVSVSGLSSGVASIATGTNHTCAVTTSGSAKCWGYNATGQLGTGNKITSSIPVDVAGLTSGVASITAGLSHSCAITTSGGAKCWGDNSQGQLGNRTTTNSSVPVDVSELASGTARIAGGDNHTCAATTASGAKCWGRNTSGQLGNNTTVSSSASVEVMP